MELMSIGEFARQSRLSQKVLRLYDELGLLLPARVDPDSGYRSYEIGQLERARLVATLREIGVPLAEIKVVIGLEPQVAARQVAGYWSGVERDHAARRDLANYIVNSLNGKRSVMYEVATRRSRRAVAVSQAERGSTGGLGPRKGVRRNPQGPPVVAYGRCRRGCLLHLPRRGQRGQRRSDRMVPAGARGRG